MLEKIKEIIAESLGTEISTLTEETSFKEDLGADSLDLFEMVMALEEGRLQCGDSFRGSGEDQDDQRCERLHRKAAVRRR